MHCGKQVKVVKVKIDSLLVLCIPPTKNVPAGIDSPALAELVANPRIVEHHGPGPGRWDLPSPRRRRRSRVQIREGCSGSAIHGR